MVAMVAMKSALSPRTAERKTKRVSWGDVDIVKIVKMVVHVEEDNASEVVSHKAQQHFPSLLSSMAFSQASQAIFRPPPGLENLASGKVPLDWRVSMWGAAPNIALQTYAPYGATPNFAPQTYTPYGFNYTAPPLAQETMNATEHATPTPTEENTTTIMLQNIPQNVDRTMILELLKSFGLNGHYDFAYLPLDFKSGMNLGYGFVNFTSHENALRAFELLNGYSKWGRRDNKTFEVAWRNKHQGLESNIDLIRNSTVMHDLVPDEFKPLLFKDGVMVEFPSPTKAIPVPKKLLGSTCNARPETLAP